MSPDTCDVCFSGCIGWFAKASSFSVLYFGFHGTNPSSTPVKLEFECSSTNPTFALQLRWLTYKPNWWLAAFTTVKKFTEVHAGNVRTLSCIGCCVAICSCLVEQIVYRIILFCHASQPYIRHMFHLDSSGCRRNN